ncbi:hypothetical protein DSO57_1039410, partial [Entomophthora muscae]
EARYTDSGEHEVPEVSSTRLAPPGSRKGAPVPSIEDFPYSSFSKTQFRSFVRSRSYRFPARAKNKLQILPPDLQSNYLGNKPQRYAYMTSEHSRFSIRTTRPVLLLVAYPADTFLRHGSTTAIVAIALIAHQSKIQQEDRWVIYPPEQLIIQYPMPHTARSFTASSLHVTEPYNHVLPPPPPPTSAYHPYPAAPPSHATLILELTLGLDLCTH